MQNHSFTPNLFFFNFLQLPTFVLDTVSEMMPTVLTFDLPIILQILDHKYSYISSSKYSTNNVYTISFEMFKT